MHLLNNCKSFKNLADTANCSSLRGEIHGLRLLGGQSSILDEEQGQSGETVRACTPASSAPVKNVQFQ